MSSLRLGGSGFEGELLSQITALLGQVESDPRRSQELARSLHAKHFTSAGKPRCSAAQRVPLLLKLSVAASGLLLRGIDTAWSQPRSLIGLDTCSQVLHSTSCALRAMSDKDLSDHDLSSAPAFDDKAPRDALFYTGIFTAVATACSKASTILQQQGSTAALHWSFSQYVAALLALWNDMMRLLPTSVTRELSENDALAAQLLPGAQLAAAALTTYLGPDAAAISSSDGRLPSGYTFTPVLPNLPSQQSRQQEQRPVASVLAAAVVAHALRVAETLSLCCYFFYMTKSQGTGVVPAGRSLAGKVLRDAAVLKLGLVMLLLEAKSRFDAQGGKTAVPRTKRSGRPLQQAASRQQAVLVPPHHNFLAEALGMQPLTDTAFFSEVVGVGLSPYRLGILVVENSLDKYLATVCGVFPPVVAQMAHVSLKEVADSTQEVTGPLPGRTIEAAALVCVELCLLGDKYTQESALRLLSALSDCLMQLSVGTAEQRGLSPGAIFQTTNTTFFEGSNPLAVPVLQQLANPVLQGLVSDVVPVLLPTCHVIPTPSALQEFRGTLSAILPQQVFKLAVQAEESCLQGLLLDHPLPCTRALEAALRTDHSERFVTQPVRCLLLRTLPLLLASLGLPAPNTSSTVPTAAAAPAPASSPATTAPAPGPASAPAQVFLGPSAATAPTVSSNGLSRLVTAAVGSQQLQAQLHGLLVTVAKTAARLNDAVAVGAGGSNPAVDELLVAQDVPSVAQKAINAMMAFRNSTLSGANQFRGSLAVLGSTAAAACSLGRAACLAASEPVGSTAAGANSNSTIVTSSSSSSRRDVTAMAAPTPAAATPAPPAAANTTSSTNNVPAVVSAAAPFESLAGRCMYLVAGAVAQAQSLSSLQPEEFSTVAEALRAVLCCGQWLHSEPACATLLAAAGGGGSSQEATGQQQLQQQLVAATSQLLALLDGSSDGRSLATQLVETGLANQLQGVGAALCNVSSGVCANPACRALAEMSELALVSAPGKTGKCAACGACSYCSRQCQRAHWGAHKPFCTVRKAAARGAPPAAEAPSS